MLVVGRSGSGKTGIVDRVIEAAGRAGHSVTALDDAERATVDAVQEACARLSDHDRSVIVTAHSLRPSSIDLALLCERLVVGGEVVELGPLDDDELANGVATMLQAPADGSLLAAIRTLTGGDPTFTRVLVQGWKSEARLERGRLRDSSHVPDPPAALRHLIAARCGRLTPESRIWLGAAVTAPDVAGPAVSASDLLDLGLIGADLRAVPLVVATLHAVLDPDELAAAHTLASDWLSRRGNPQQAAHLLRTAGADDDIARGSYVAAAAADRATDPTAALGWLELAAHDDATSLGARASTHALAGTDAEAMLWASKALAADPDEPNARAAIASALARTGNWQQVAVRIEGITGHPTIPDEAWPWFVELARRAGGQPTPVAPGYDGRASSPMVDVLARIATIVDRSAAAAGPAIADLRRSIPAALAGIGGPSPWLDAPTTPHEWIAALRLAMGDARSAAQVLHTFVPGVTVGVAASRAAALRTWTELRLGQTITPDVIDEIDDRLVLFALRAGVARRSGDVRKGGDAIREFGASLGQLVIDPLNLDAALELFVAARRFGPRSLAADLGDRIADVLADLPSPMWRVRFHWASLEAALAARDVDATSAPIDALAAAGELLPTARPLARAAAAWRSVAAGRPDMNEVEGAVEELREVDLSWEAAQLAGQAAIRVDDASSARQLLVRARSLRGAASEGDRTVTTAGLSEREVEVGLLVLDGRTHKDIGERLYISPKTVEHHVAHIRSKLGVTTRAEFLAALRHDLASRQDS